MSIPQQLNHYRIVAPLGKGGMGEVFLAEDTRLQRRVALKVLPSVLASDPERRQRFEREAQAVAALNHPSIVTIHSVEEADGIPFLTMELVEGRPLSELITEGGMPVDALLRIGIAVSDAIAAAHQRGITHRDLKPANILVTTDGRVKVLDFGLAKLRDAEADAAEGDVTRMPASDLTGEGRIIGTVAYMSPEQAEGRPVDQRSDIFSLGVVLHEMATGERPFKGDTNVSVISSILKDTPSSVTDLNPALPTGLAKVIRRSLAKDPSRRYQTSVDLRNELEELKQEIDSAVTIVAGPRPGVQRVDRPAPTRLIVAGVLVVIAVLAAAWAYWTARGDDNGSALSMTRMSRLTSSGTASLAAVSPDGRYVVHVKNGGAPSLWVRQTATTSDVQIVPPGPVRYDGVSYSPDGDHVYYVTYERTGGVGTLYRIAVLGGVPQRVLEDVDSRISFSPDGTQFTFTRGAPAQGTAWLMVANTDGSVVRQLSSLEAPAQFTLSGPAWSPDGRTILAAAQSLRGGPHALLISVDVASGTPTPLEGRWNNAGDIEWLPDGRSFLVAATEVGSGTTQLWQVTYPGAERRRLTNDLNNYVSLSLSDDASALATVQAEAISTLWVAPAHDPGGGAQITRGRGRGDGLAGLAWMPDGRIVFGSVATGLPQIWIVDANGENLRQLTTQDDPSFAPRPTADGRFIVFQRFSGTAMQLWRMSADGGDQRRVTDQGVATGPVPDNGDVVYYTELASGSPRPFRVSLDGGTPELVSDSYFRVVDVSTNGELLGVGWDATERRSTAAILPASGGTPRFIAKVPAAGLAWASEGRAITFAGPHENGMQIYRYELNAPSADVLGLVEEAVFAYAWSPDRRRIALARGQNTSDVLLVSLSFESSKAER